MIASTADLVFMNSYKVSWFKILLLKILALYIYMLNLKVDIVNVYIDNAIFPWTNK